MALPLSFKGFLRCPRQHVVSLPMSPIIGTNHKNFRVSGAGARRKLHARIARRCSPEIWPGRRRMLLIPSVNACGRPLGQQAGAVFSTKPYRHSSFLKSTAGPRSTTVLV